MNINNSVDRLLGSAQFRLSLLIVIGYLAAIAAIFWRVKDLTNTQVTLVTGLLATLGTVFTLVANFWFSRHRPQGAQSDGVADDTTTQVPTSPAAGPAQSTTTK